MVSRVLLSGGCCWRWIFVGGVGEVLAQPFRLRFTTVEGSGEHTPDFLALTPGSGWLLDVRPVDRIKDEDVLRFAAASQAAAAVGWRYAVVTGWRREAMTGIGALSVRRRPMHDRLGLQERLLELAWRRPMLFGELVEATDVPAVARVHAVHLLWHRRLAVDLTLQEHVDKPQKCERQEHYAHRQPKINFLRPGFRK